MTPFLTTIPRLLSHFEITQNTYNSYRFTYQIYKPDGTPESGCTRGRENFKIYVFIGFPDAIFARLVLLMMSVCKFNPSIYHIYKRAETRDIDTLVKC